MPCSTIGSMTYAAGAHRFLYQGWSVSISLQASVEKGEVHARADLVDAGTAHHQLELEGQYREGATALRALSSQARAFIDRGLPAS